MSGVGGTGDTARRKFGMDEPGEWGVVGQGGGSWLSSPQEAEVDELRGSNIVEEVMQIVQFNTHRSAFVL